MTLSISETSLLVDVVFDGINYYYYYLVTVAT